MSPEWEAIGGPRTLWREKHENRWVRYDGAVVLYDVHSPHPNPLNPNCRMWTAWEPDPSEMYLRMTNGRLGWPKRFKTPQNAMKAVDKAFPSSVLKKQ